MTDQLKSETKTRSEKFKAILPLLYLILALFALRWSIVEPYVVPTGSMEPTLKPGDRLYALKCAYDVRIPFTEKILFHTGSVKRGDVILFRAPATPDITYVKRAVGLPGDKLEFHQGVFYVNGQAIQRTPLEDRDIMYDIEYKDDKTLFIEDYFGVKHYMILDNLRPNLRDTSEDRFYPQFRSEGIVIPPGFLFAMGDNRDNSHDSRAWGLVPVENLKGRAMFIWFSSKDFRPRPERIGTLIQ